MFLIHFLILTSYVDTCIRQEAYFWSWGVCGITMQICSRFCWYIPLAEVNNVFEKSLKSHFEGQPTYVISKMNHNQSLMLFFYTRLILASSVPFAHKIRMTWLTFRLFSIIITNLHIPILEDLARPNNLMFVALHDETSELNHVGF